MNLFTYSFIMKGRVLLCSPGWLGTDYIVQAGFELIMNVYLQFSKYWNYRLEPQCPGSNSNIKEKNVKQLYFKKTKYTFLKNLFIK